MCYSAQIQADYRRHVRTFGAHMDIEEFARLYFERAEAARRKSRRRSTTRSATHKAVPSNEAYAAIATGYGR
jgi:hypothetical protein